LPGLESHGFDSFVTVAVIPMAVKVEILCDEGEFLVEDGALPSARKQSPLFVSHESGCFTTDPISNYVRRFAIVSRAAVIDLAAVREHSARHRKSTDVFLTASITFRSKAFNPANYLPIRAIAGAKNQSIEFMQQKFMAARAGKIKPGASSRSKSRSQGAIGPRDLFPASHAPGRRKP
jgi:hypothetical protein